MTGLVTTAVLHEADVCCAVHRDRGTLTKRLYRWHMIGVVYTTDNQSGGAPNMCSKKLAVVKTKK